MVSFKKILEVDIPVTKYIPLGHDNSPRGSTIDFKCSTVSSTRSPTNTTMSEKKLNKSRKNKVLIISDILSVATLD